MELICPLCNGLKKFEIECEKCRERMVDEGRIADYYDNYSSYLEMSITERIDGVPCDQCVHLFSCPSCKHDKRIVIHKILK